VSRALVALVAIAAGLAAAAGSCSVRRQSDGYGCASDRDCDGDRICDDGFCVEAGSSGQCPSQCDSCDTDELTCRIECNPGQPCDAVHCPAGYDCTIRCSSAGACADIDCAAAASCDIRCAGGNACGNVNCAGQCEITCAGGHACGEIDCAASCSCRFTCNAPMDQCPPLRCPAGCDAGDGTCSTEAPQCDQCP
jgi:hypothetical protein